MYTDIEKQIQKPVQSDSESIIFENADIVTPTGVLTAASLHIENGIIVQIKEGHIADRGQRFDCQRHDLLPGMIDIHSDALEKYVEPRPKGLFPLNAAILNFERTLVTFGITTMYHCVAALKFDTQARLARQKETAFNLIKEINRLKPLMLSEAKIHFRYDMIHPEIKSEVMVLVEDGQIDLLSIMDHTPGQGQYPDKEAYLDIMKGYTNQSRHELESLTELKLSLQNQIDPDEIEQLALFCFGHGLPLASHDDDSNEKIEWIQSMGITICEFPVNQEAVAAAKKRDMAIVFGAPNVLRGASLSGNISAQEAISNGYGNILCSDYAPMSMLHSVYLLVKENMLSLEKAVNMVSLNPAIFAGIAREKGSIELGKSADLILVDQTREVPLIKKTLIKGKEVFGVN